jgi:hypothetical protein
MYLKDIFFLFLQCAVSPVIFVRPAEIMQSAPDLIKSESPVNFSKADQYCSKVNRPYKVRKSGEIFKMLCKGRNTF